MRGVGDLPSVDGSVMVSLGRRMCPRVDPIGESDRCRSIKPLILSFEHHFDPVAAVLAGFDASCDNSSPSCRLSW
jgi:hypothetical protein